MNAIGLPDSVLRRFWRKVRIGDGCWEWQAAHNGVGYGVINIDGRMVLATRLSLEMTEGPLGPGQQANHHCDNPPCVRPDHLYAGTAKDNTRDMWERGRGYVPTAQRGANHPVAKLTEDEVREIRRRYATGTVGQRPLAREYGVSRSAIQHVVKRKTYADVQ